MSSVLQALQKEADPALCRHANEVPATCPCPSTCYCAWNSCRAQHNDVHRDAYPRRDAYPVEPPIVEAARELANAEIAFTKAEAAHKTAVEALQTISATRDKAQAEVRRLLDGKPAPHQIASDELAGRLYQLSEAAQRVFIALPKDMSSVNVAHLRVVTKLSVGEISGTLGQLQAHGLAKRGDVHRTWRRA